MHLTETRPFIVAKAENTKNGKIARQYIQPATADRLLAMMATKHSAAPVFKMPHESDVAEMMREDLSAARAAWIKEVKNDPQELSQRREADFLADTNHEGQVIDFHSLRHTCGAWLAQQGHPAKVVQSVMRHSTITLTMDTYGHLFPGQEADPVLAMQPLFDGPTEPQQLRATGTDDVLIETSGSDCTQNWVYEQAAIQCNSVRFHASSCDEEDAIEGRQPERKSLPIENLESTPCDSVQLCAT